MGIKKIEQRVCDKCGRDLSKGKNQGVYLPPDMAIISDGRRESIFDVRPTHQPPTEGLDLCRRCAVERLGLGGEPAAG